jgi:hypothetical protein
MTFIIALAWLIGLILAAPLAIAGGIVFTYRLGWRPVAAIPAGVLLGAAAAPTFLMSAYFLVGWPLAIVLWLFGGAWHRFVGNIRVVQVGFTIMFTIAWLAVMSADQFVARFGDPHKLATDGGILLSLLAACLIVLEFSAVTWGSRPPKLPATPSSPEVVA